MQGVEDLRSFRAKLATREFWADAWAAEVVQCDLRIKPVIIRDGVVQVDAMPQLPDGWGPEAYVALRYTGNHYDLLHGVEPYRVRFQLDELPVSFPCGRPQTLLELGDKGIAKGLQW